MPIEITPPTPVSHEPTPVGKSPSSTGNPNVLSISHQTLSANRPLLAIALGNVPTAFYEAVVHNLPTDYLTDWEVTVVGNTTDTVAQAIIAEGEKWTTLLVTTKLQGVMPLPQLLVNIKRRYPHIRIAVIFDHATKDVSKIVATLSAFNIYNVLVKEDIQFDEIIELVTTDLTWDKIEPFLDPDVAPDIIAASPPTAPTPQTVPEALANTLPAVPDKPPVRIAAQTIVVVAGKGGVGKTGFVANCLVAAARWGTIGIDADYVKPTLPIYFHNPNQPAQADMRQLINAIHTNHAASGRGDVNHIVSDDDKDIQSYMDNCEMMPGGFQIITGASRISSQMPPLPAGLITKMIQLSKERTRLTFVDTPNAMDDPVWLEAVQAADHIVVIATPEYASILETVDVIRRFHFLQIPLNKVWLVINKRGKIGYSTEEITRNQLKEIPLLATIPYEPERWERSIKNHRALAEQQTEVWLDIVQKLTGLIPERSARKKHSLFPWKK